MTAPGGVIKIGAVPENSPERHVLLTGFEPFDGESVNPSQEVVKLLDGATVATPSARSSCPSSTRQPRGASPPRSPRRDWPGAHLGLAGANCKE